MNRNRYRFWMYTGDIPTLRTAAQRNYCVSRAANTLNYTKHYKKTLARRHTIDTVRASGGRSEDNRLRAYGKDNKRALRVKRMYGKTSKYFFRDFWLDKTGQL